MKIVKIVKIEAAGSIMVKTYGSRFPPFLNLDKVIISFDKLNNTDLFPSIHGVYIVHLS